MSFTPALLDVLVPESCPACGGPRGLQSHTRLCRSCDATVSGLPVAIPAPATVAGAWVLGPYPGALGAMVRRGKYAPDPGVIDELGRRLARAARGRLPQIDLVTSVPVPLGRRLRRGFDQAERLARPVATALGAPWLRLLDRVRPGEQAGRSLSDRAFFARGAFAVRAGLDGSRVLLVDDVFTTGATVGACASELLGAGAGRVYVLAVAHQPLARVAPQGTVQAFARGPAEASQDQYGRPEPCAE